MEVALVAGTGLQAASSIFGGQAAAQSAAVDARIASINRQTLEKTADVQRLYADLSLRRAAAEEAKSRTETRTVIGAQRAYYASSSLDPAMGGPLLLAGVTAAQGEVDAGLIRAQGQLDYASGLTEAASTQAGAATAAYQEVAANLRGQNAIIAGILGAGTALLGGAMKWPGLGGGGAGTVTTPTVTDLRGAQAFGLT